MALFHKSTFLVKVDIKSAYRMVLVHPEDGMLLGKGLCMLIFVYLLDCNQPQESLQPWQMPLNEKLSTGVSHGYHTIWMINSPLGHQDPRSVLQM